MAIFLTGWYVDASPGGAADGKCGEKLAAIGISGTSNMTDTIVLNSFPYLVGQTCSVMIGGLDCGDIVVAADGSLTVPYRSDPESLLTASYLTGISSLNGYGDLEAHIEITDSSDPLSPVVTDVYVPVVVGYGYTSKAQLLRPVTQDEMKTQKGPGHGKIRRMFRFAMHLWNAGKVKVGTDFDHLMTQKLLHHDRNTELASNAPFNGIHEATVNDTNSLDGQLAWQVDRPFPLGVISTTTFTNVEDR